MEEYPTLRDSSLKAFGPTKFTADHLPCLLYIEMTSLQLHLRVRSESKKHFQNIFHTIFIFPGCIFRVNRDMCLGEFCSDCARWAIRIGSVTGDPTQVESLYHLICRLFFHSMFMVMIHRSHQNHSVLWTNLRHNQCSGSEDCSQRTCF